MTVWYNKAQCDDAERSYYETLSRPAYKPSGGNSIVEQVRVLFKNITLILGIIRYPELGNIFLILWRR